MKLKTARLGDVCEFLDHMRVPVEGSERKSGPYPYYGANGQQGWIDGYIFDEPLVLLAEDGGHFGSDTKPIAYKVLGKCWVNNHAHVLRPKPDIDVDYLHRVLSFFEVMPYVSGTTRLKLTKGKAQEIPIPLPSLPEQQRTAGILSRADRLRRLRRYALEMSDGYLQAVFLEMFGDPATNPMGWEVHRLGKHIRFLTSGPRGWAEHYSPTGVRFIRSLDVQMNQISEGNVTYVMPPTNAEANRTKVRPGDVLLTITGSRIGRVAYVEDRIGEAYVSQHVAIIRLGSELRPDFVSMFLSHPRGGQEQIARLQYGQTKPGLNLEQIQAFQVPVPPRQEQERYSLANLKVSRLRSQQREALRQAEQLFQTLLHGAFRGEG